MSSVKKSRVVEGEDDSSSEEVQGSRRVSAKSRPSAVRNNRRSVVFRQPPSLKKKDDDDEGNEDEETRQVEEITLPNAPVVPSDASATITPSQMEEIPQTIPTNADQAKPPHLSSPSPAVKSPSLSPLFRAARHTQRCPPMERETVVKPRVSRSQGVAFPATADASMGQLLRELNPSTMGGGPVAVGGGGVPPGGTLVWLNSRYDDSNDAGGPMSESAWAARHGIPGQLGLSAHRAIRSELEYVFVKGFQDGFFNPVGAVSQSSRGHTAAAGRSMRSVQLQCDAMNGFVQALWNSNVAKIPKA